LTVLTSRVDPRFQGITFLLRDRFNSLSKMITNTNTWTPPSLQLIRFAPGLRTVAHPALAHLLPSIPDEDDDPDPYSSYGLMEEWNRPTGGALTDYFKDSLADFQDDATVEDASKTLGLSVTTERLPGANFTLMPHQILGVSFMVKREMHKGKGGRGGMLCDAMGLGKTVQTIGLMLARNERPADYERAPQLIVAPLALLSQWKCEIEEKTSNGWRVSRHSLRGSLHMY
jgi:SNF2 family DNA or RNA helicase